MPITVDLDPDKKLDPSPNLYKVSGDAFAKSRIDATKRLELIKHSIDSDICHKGYAAYLDMAWSYHYGVVLTPDIFWFTLMRELAAVVQNEPETYRKFFTRSNEKVQIAVHGINPGELPLDKIMAELHQLVPHGLTEYFLPEFSTTDPTARLARYASFADTVKSYYGYSVYMCGIPAFRLEGTVEDWRRIKTCWQALSDVFLPIKDYCARVSAIVDRLISQFWNPDPGFLRDIYSVPACLDACMPQYIEGWFADLFVNGGSGKWAAAWFPDHVASVPYTCIATEAKYELHAGLFSSKLVDGFLVPSFGTMTLREIAMHCNTLWCRELATTTCECGLRHCVRCWQHHEENRQQSPYICAAMTVKQP